MFLFIGESIGWQELFLIGVLALIFLGPRKLPQLAKTIGRTMADLRNAGQEFRNTWEREVSLEEEEKNFLKNPLDENLILTEDKYREPVPANENKIPVPEIREVTHTELTQPKVNEEIPTETPAANAVGKQDWL